MFKKRVYFDKEYQGYVEGVDKKDTLYTIRIEGKIVKETENEYKIKTYSFWSWNGYYGLTVRKYPHNIETRKKLQTNNLCDVLNVQNYYWVKKPCINFFK